MLDDNSYASAVKFEANERSFCRNGSPMSATRQSVIYSKDEMIMPTRLLSIAFASFFCAVAQAQLSSDRFSPINYFGRYHGFGYSDGYHACKDGRCNTGSSWINWTGVSTFYGEPTPPPSSRFAPMRAPGFLPRYSQDEYVAPIFNDGLEYSSHTLPTPSSMMQMQPSPQVMTAPQSTIPLQNFYESVPAVPRDSQSSPSDRSLELPAPLSKPESVSPAPQVQSRRVPPGTHSLIQQSTFRLR